MRRVWPGLCALLIGIAGICRAQDEVPGGAIQPQAPAAAPSNEPVPDPNIQASQKPFYKKLFTAQAFLATVPGAALQQWHDWPGEWGRTRTGFEKRAASLYGQFVIGALIEDGIRAIHHEDTRYRRMGQGNFFRRTGHALTATFVAYKPDGGRTAAYSLVANAYGSWAVATLWSPRELRTPESIAEWGTAGLGVTVASGVLREFWPDLKGLLRKKK